MGCVGVLVEALCVREDVTAAIATLEELDRKLTRIYGASHPQTGATRDRLAEAREKLAAEVEIKQN